MTTRTGARQPLEPAAPIAVDEKPGALSIEIRLPRAAAINGRVIDESGEPVVETPVSASRMVRAAAHTRLVPVASTTTDDLGEYRLSGLPGGLYVVSAEPTPSVEGMAAVFVDSSGNATAGVFTQRWALVYYPSATSLGQAQPISLRPGQETSSIDLTVRPRTVGRVMLTVLDSNGNPASGMAILESASSTQPIRVQQPFFEGRLPIVVDQGEWDVAVDGRRAGAAMTHISVGEADVTGTVTLGKAPHLNGRVLVDGAPPPVSGAAVVAAVPELATSFGSYFAPLNRDGTFVLDGVLGTIDLRLRDAPPGWFVQSVSVGGRQLPDTTLKISGTADVGDVVVQVSSRASVLSGAVTDSAGGPFPGTSVLVFPKNTALLVNPARWTRWVKSDQNGRFTTGALPAGEYYAVAVTDVDESQWSTGEYLEPLRRRAQSVSLAAGERKSVTLASGDIR